MWISGYFPHWWVGLAYLYKMYLIELTKELYDLNQNVVTWHSNGLCVM